MRIVIKLGTSTLTAGTSHLSPPLIIELARQVKTLSQQHQLVIVTSGAIAAGREKLNRPQLPKTIPNKQMLAAVGQPHLMALYESIFSMYALTVAQILLTRADLASRNSYLNARTTFNTILEQGIIPVVNENDTIATEEIRVGDNDNLSALVANLIDADWLILLTDQNGLYTADPRTNPSASLVKEVSTSRIPASLWQAAGGSGSNLGTGGMTTKLEAVELARRSGTTCVIASYQEKDVLLRLIAGELLGTRFNAVASTLENRKRYILSMRKTPGKIMIDAGAANALQQGGSLLPVGVINHEGQFERGDTVSIISVDHAELGRGMVNYNAHDLKKISRHRSEEIESILGYDYGDEVIHRNNLVIL